MTNSHNDKRIDRLQVMLDAAELEALDSWRFAKRMPSRSAAVRELLRRGLAADGHFETAAPGNSSSDFGVLESDGGKDGKD